MIYQYEGCCGVHIHERTCRLADYIAEPSHACPHCGRALKQIISAPRILFGGKPFEPFISPVDRTLITSKQGLAEHNRRNNVVNTHDGYDEAAVQRMIHQDHNEPKEAERRKDLKDDAQKAVDKLLSGYTPTPAHEGDIE